MNQFGITGVTKDGQTPTGDMMSDLHMLYKWLYWFPCTVQVSDGRGTPYTVILHDPNSIHAGKSIQELLSCFCTLQILNICCHGNSILFLSWCAVDYQAYRPQTCKHVGIYQVLLVEYFTCTIYSSFFLLLTRIQLG